MPETSPPVPPARFSAAEPIVATGASVSGGVVLTSAALDLADAFGRHLTGPQEKAIIVIVTVVLALIGSMIARRKVTPTWKAAAIEAIAAPLEGQQDEDRAEVAP